MSTNICINFGHTFALSTALGLELFVYFLVRAILGTVCIAMTVIGSLGFIQFIYLFFSHFLGGEELQCLHIGQK